MERKDVERVAKAERKLRKAVESMGGDYASLSVCDACSFFYVSQGEGDPELYRVGNGVISRV